MNNDSPEFAKRANAAYLELRSHPGRDQELLRRFGADHRLVDLVRELFANEGGFEQDAGGELDHAAEEADSVLRSRIGRFRIAGKPKRGGMGEVYHVYDDQHGVAFSYALKHLTRADSTNVNSFLREVETLKRLDSRRIARFHEAGTDEDGVPYCLMEWVNGSPITDYCKGNRLTLRQRIRLFLQVCEAVAYLHCDGCSESNQRTIHSDIKPHNILVNTHGEVKVVDFGIALSAKGRAGVQPVGWTFEYASPEQKGEKAVTTSTDLFSMGVVLLELLTGVQPSVRSNYRKSEFRLTNRELSLVQPDRLGIPETPAQIEQYLGTYLGPVLPRILHPDVDGRIRSATEFNSVLQLILREDVGRLREIGGHGRWLGRIGL